MIRRLNYHQVLTPNRQSWHKHQQNWLHSPRLEETLVLHHQQSSAGLFVCLTAPS